MISTDGHRLSKFGKTLAKGPKAGQRSADSAKRVAEIRSGHRRQGRPPARIGDVHQGYFVRSAADDMLLTVKLTRRAIPTV